MNTGSEEDNVVNQLAAQMFVACQSIANGYRSEDAGKAAIMMALSLVMSCIVTDDLNDAAMCVICTIEKWQETGFTARPIGEVLKTGTQLN